MYIQHTAGHPFAVSCQPQGLQGRLWPAARPAMAPVLCLRGERCLTFFAVPGVFLAGVFLAGVFLAGVFLA